MINNPKAMTENQMRIKINELEEEISQLTKKLQDTKIMDAKLEADLIETYNTFNKVGFINGTSSRALGMTKLSDAIFSRFNYRPVYHE